jgi:polycystin 2
MDGLYWESYYNGKAVPKDQLGYIYYENKLLGRPRLRQLRVRSNSCVVHDDFKREIKNCYGPYTADNEDKNTYGLGNGTAWNYQTAKQLNGGSFWGRMATYQGGGYTQLLGSNKTSSKAMMAELKKNLWVDRGTRAVMIDFTVYNANINLFCIVTLVLEYPATGGCIPFHMFRTLKLIRYVTTMDYFIMGCEGLFVLFLMYYTIEEIIEIKKHKTSYFKDFWNIMDLVVVLMGYVCVLFSVYRTMEVGKLLSGLLKDKEQYANFEVLGYWQMQFNNLVAIAVFFAWIKVFKYISFNKTMTQLQNTLASCAKDIAGFAVMFFIIFLAYAQWGYLIFGTQVQDFSTYMDSIFTLFRIILGDFNFKEIEDANRILGPIFFITYVFFVFFVLINMFLAIINDTYAEVKADLESKESEFEIGDYFKKGYDKMMNKLSFKREKIVDIQKALQTADSNQDSKLDFEEWRQELKNRGHADAEIEAVFAKYDVDGDRCLNEEEQIKMQEDLEGQKDELNEEIEEVNRAKDVGKSRISMRDSDDEDEDEDCGRRRGGISSEEFAVLSRRVDRVEHSIGSIVSKIDAVLVKLEAMDKAKVKRRETMTKLLDSITEDCKGDETARREKMENIVRSELDRWDSSVSVRDSRVSLRDGKK